MPNPRPEEAHDGLPAALLTAAADRLAAAVPAARAQVIEELLQQHPGHADQLRRLAAELAAVSRLLDAGLGVGAEEPATPLPSVIGAYRVQRVLGEGAFGIVYLCTQEEPVRREVAVKVLRPGAGDRSTLVRFDAERQFLARQNHPAIAQIFDAGVLPDGRPWFVMEHVRGQPITKFCDQQRLSIEARVALFQRLCQGVQHAHAQGIVHRDLKPENILVVEVDGEPQPKIIDFGIAKALEHTHAGDPVATETGRVIGTPGYMSPEQAAGRRDDVDARSDVFSLGVILYELLSGELPWGQHPAATDTEPPRPSRRVATGSKRSTTVASQRGSQPRQLASSLRGDLDWIVLKALARERSRRYPTAQELAADLGRHLRCEPVHAGPPSLRYRLRKGVRRHRSSIAATGGILFAVALGLWSTWHYRGEANARESEAAAVVAQLLARASDQAIRAAPETGPLRRALLQDALDFQERFLRERPADRRQRGERVNTLCLLASVHLALGECQRAIATAREAVVGGEELLTAAPDEYRFLLARARSILGGALNNAGEVGAAQQEMRQAILQFEQCMVTSPQHAPWLAGTMFDLYATMDLENEADAATAVDLLTRARSIQEDFVRREPGSDEAKAGMVRMDLGLLELRMAQGDVAEAEVVLQHAEDVLASQAHADLESTVRVHLARARLASAGGDHDTAIDRLEKGIAAAQLLCDRDPSDKVALMQLAETNSMLAGQQHEVGDYAARDSSLRAAIESVATHVSRFPDLHSARGTLAKWLSNYAFALTTYGRRGVLAEAEASARRAIEALAGLPAAFDGKERELIHWQALCRLCLILDADGRSDPALWDEAGRAMLAFGDRYGIDRGCAPAFAEALVRIARHRIATGRDDLAARDLDRLEAVLGEELRTSRDLSMHAVEALRLRALLAARGGRSAAAAEMAERVLALDADWRRVLAAADALRAACSAARAAGEPVATITAYRDRSIEALEAAAAALEPLVGASPEDLWVVVPLAQARVRLASLLTERGESGLAETLLTPAMQTLEAVRNEAFASEWDGAVFEEGRRLRAR